jgi:predicted dehydrogenase
VEAGIPVILDKPMVASSEEARNLCTLVEDRRALLAVTYNYTGYPMVRHAAYLVRTGAIGTVRKVFVEYHQGWLATDLERTGHKQAAWRNDPGQAGAGGSIADIGTHAENLLSTVTGLAIESLCAELTSFVPGRALDDDAAVLMRLQGGARAVLTVTQVAIGEQNNLTLRVHGDRGTLAWGQEHPDHLTLHTLDGVSRILSRGTALSPFAADATRLPPGHPEGFIEAFANIYRGVAQAIRARASGTTRKTDGEFPTVRDGARGVAFIEHVVRSAKAGGTWVKWEG